MVRTRIAIPVVFMFGLHFLAAGEGELHSQTAWRIPIIVSDNGGKSDTLKFGVHPTGTYCPDSHTLKFGNCDSVKESELPPTPPLGVFDARFINHRGSGGACFGGGQSEHIQAFTGPGDIDTFRIVFQAGSGGPPFTLSWPAGLASFADSIIIEDTFVPLPPGGGGFRFDLATVNSFTVPETPIAFDRVNVIVYRPKTPALPETPTLSLPANEAVNVDTNVTFTWTASTGAAWYVLQVSTDSLFGSFALRETLTTTTRTVRLPANARYFWHVNAGSVFLNGCFQDSPSRFSTISTAPAAPTLVSPANGATGVVVSPTLTWNASPTATSYRVEVSRNAAFTSIEFVDSAVTGTSRVAGPFLNCVTRFWRVRASNANGTGDWSATRSFTVELAVPAAPAPVAPADGAAGLGTSPTLSWTGADSCSRNYRLEVSTDSNFSAPLVFDNITTTSRVVGPLAELTTHYWRVRAANQGGGAGAFGPVRRFTTLLNPPAAPSKVSPADGDTTVNPVASLLWHAVANADTYVVQVASDAGYTTIVASATTTDTTYQTSPLVNCRTYFWRVGALNASGAGPTSASTQFRIARATSGAITLLSPNDGETGVKEMVTLTWQPEICAFNYRVEVATDAGFTSIVVDQTVPGTSLGIGPLVGNTDHFWRVRGVNNVGQGTTSAAFVFKTTPLTTPSAPILVSPADGATSLPLPVTLCWDSAARAASYRLQLAVDSNFTTLVFNETTPPTVLCRQFTFLLNSTRYFWRVNATNNAGTGGWSQTRDFTTLSPPVSPLLIYPPNAADDLTPAPIFVWSVPQNAVSYRLQIGRDSLFTSIFSDDSGLVNTSWQAGPFASRTRYYWRVQAKNSVGPGPFSGTFTFRTAFIGVANWLMPLEVRETGPARDTIYMGLHPDATCGVDPSLGEFEMPPLPPAGTFDARFITPPASGGCTLGQGLRVNLLGFETYAQVDTYRVRIQVGTGDYPIRFNWSSSLVRSVCDSMVLRDEFGGADLRVRMDQAESATLSNPAISTVLLVKYGAHPMINDIQPPRPRTPEGFMLSQNYPNPFNPTTTVAFATDHEAELTLAVFDVLGREISRIARGRYQPGSYTVTWNGTDGGGEQMPSGVYYIRLTGELVAAGGQAGDAFSTTRKMLMIK